MNRSIARGVLMVFMLALFVVFLFADDWEVSVKAGVGVMLLALAQLSLAGPEVEQS